jgi:hypothetical protein
LWRAEVKDAQSKGGSDVKEISSASDVISFHNIETGDDSAATAAPAATLMPSLPMQMDQS